MDNEEQNQLSEGLHVFMQDLRLVLLTTLAEENKPYVNAISWTYAKSPKEIRFAVANGSKIVENIKQNNEVALTIFYDDSIYTVNGTATISSEIIEGIPLKLAMVSVSVNSLFDVMFYGSKISQLPQTEKTYNPEAAQKLDNQVLEALKA